GYNGSVVTAADAHAWVEVFIGGRGWITIDPTPPGFSGPSSLPVKLRGVLSELHLEPGTINFPVVALVIALTGCLPLLYRLLPAPRRRQASRRIGLEGDRSVIDYLTMLDLMARAGVKRRPYETPYEFLVRIRECKLPPQIDALAERLTDGFVTVRYAHESAPYDAAVIRQFREALNQKSARQTLGALRTSAPRRKPGSWRRKEAGQSAASLPVE
ncbi:MAG: transglutaminase domain-containing protein, partial [Chloroflexi bacterium]|nr:transglutaminase domain-containing protein [Chloroflexota bacterium]